MLANITHMQTPLEPLASARMVFEGRRQADGIIAFLRAEFPRIFAAARVRAYGNPGIRQTRWIVSRRQLTLRTSAAPSALPMRSRDALGGSSCTTLPRQSIGSDFRRDTSTTSPWLHGAERRRQHSGCRALRGRGYAGVVGDSRHGSLHRDGYSSGARICSLAGKDRGARSRTWASCKSGLRDNFERTRLKRASEGN